MDSAGFDCAPSLIFGTADRESHKALPLYQAIAMGHRVLDVASNDPHDESAIGAMLCSLLSHAAPTDDGSNTSLVQIEQQQTRLQRNDIIIQAKYSPSSLFRHKAPPYDSSDPIPLQVLKSFQNSLTRLQLSSVDVYFLHRPFPLLEQTFSAWEVMEELVRQKGVGRLGISQVPFETLCALYARADVKPKVVQNYCGSRNGYDRQVRDFCAEHGITYQAFGVLHEVQTRPELENVDAEPSAAEMDSELMHLGQHSSHLAKMILEARRNGERFSILDGSREPSHLRDNIQAMEQVKIMLEQTPKMDHSR